MNPRRGFSYRNDTSGEIRWISIERAAIRVVQYIPQRLGDGQPITVARTRQQRAGWSSDALCNGSEKDEYGMKRWEKHPQLSLSSER